MQLLLCSCRTALGNAQSWCHWAQYSTDAVVSGHVPGFTCDDASALYGAVVAEIEDLTPYSTDAHMTQFYSVYRQLANDLKPSEEWPVFESVH